MNVPNKLTVSRFAITALFLVVLFAPIRFHETVALGLFSAAGVTDYFDGKIARRDKLITNFGILMDPLADKILVCSAFIAFVGLGWVPAWMVVLVVARELAITGLRLLAASKSLVLAAEGFGKHKTVSQVVAIAAVLAFRSYGDWGPVGRMIFQGWLGVFTTLALWFAVLMTAMSGAFYLWRNRSLYLAEV
jgi:CDP-diacylglycerol--glycerol-3-phosphate 3-phosphatidyltransferase